MNDETRRASTVRIHLLRHADAGDPEAWKGPDAERPLTAKGRSQADRLGTFLASVSFKPDMIVSSPRIRAAQTAEGVAGHLGMKVRVDDRLGEQLGIAELEALIADLGAARPLLVGHDPDLTMLIESLCDASGVEMKKGALARIDAPRPLAAGAGMLRWLVPPDLLKGS
jgi:phosphohistidine phosphatase SixA